MVQWQNQADTIIDRFDVRAHLDVIPEQVKETKTDGNTTTPTAEESQINYERYRILVQNDFAQVKEHKFLHQIYLEERYDLDGEGRTTSRPLWPHNTRALYYNTTSHSC